MNFETLSFSRWLAGLGLVVVLLNPAGAVPTSLAWAAPASPTASAKRAADAPKNKKPELATGAELVDRAYTALRTLREIRAQADAHEGLEQLHDEILTRSESLKGRIDTAKQNVREARRPFRIRDIRFSFLEDRRRIKAWEKRVSKENKRLTDGKKRTRELLEFWRRANKLAKDTTAPQVIVAHTEQVIAAARATELALAKPEAIVIPLQSTLSEMSEMVDSLLELAATEGPDLQADGAINDFAIGDAVRGIPAELFQIGPRVMSMLGYMQGMALLFLKSARRELAAHLVLSLLSVIAMFALRRHSWQWSDSGRDERVAQLIVKHPLASAVQLSALLGLLVYEEVPTVVVTLLYLMCASSAWVLFARELHVRLRRLLYIGGCFWLADLLRVLLDELPHVERLLLVAELAIFSLLLARLLGSKHWSRLPLSQGWRGFVRSVTWVWLFGAVVGTVAGLLGYGHLAEIAGGGMLRSMYLGAVYSGTVVAQSSLVWVVTQTEFARKLNFIRNHGALVVERVSTYLTWLGLFLWFIGSLRHVTLYESFARLVTGILEKGLAVGALKITLGDVAVLVIGTVLAVYVARLLRFLLNQDVLGRFAMSEGTREVAASGIFWVAALGGLFATLAAVGIQLDKLTVLAGALGVGIGFGLQNVVQNFAAGLILIFGRPIKVGDKIQLGELMGEVRSVGFRASTVRTWQGAEVIVPNSGLIADQVINWTLSDQKRRIEVMVGVKYGTDPERVIELLCEVGRAHPQVMQEPPVVALFMQHGENSLNFQLRAWVLFDDAVTVTSDLTLAVNKCFQRENIEIPFPQRDLNLSTISPEVARALLPRTTTAR